jgi:glutathione synthase/RimK-type ligase-like ATP-grasp enzyme
MDAFLETIACFQMNPYMVDRLAGNRLIQTARAQAIGLRVPASCTTQQQHRAEQFLAQFPNVVTKALSFGRLVGGDTEEAAVAFTSPVTAQTDWSGLSVAPTLLQERIPAKYDWRITTVGGALFCARVASRGDVDWRKDPQATFEQAILPPAIQDRLLQLCRLSHLAYGAHDLIETPDGEFVFLETNPAGQWGWLEVQCDLPIGEAVAEALIKNHA